MKNNKLIGIVLALLVCLSLVVSVSAATENDLTFALESSDSNVEGLNLTAVKSGENVVVNLMIPNNSGIRYAKATVTYESDVLELVDSTAVSGIKLTEKVGEVRVEIGDIMAAIDRNNNKAPFNATGAVVTLTFKALATDDVVSEIALAINGKDVIDANRETNTPSVNVAMNVNVVGTNHDHSAYGTVEADNAAEPSCTEAGKKADLICTHCGEIAKVGEEIEIIEHTKGEVVVENNDDPTCTEAGKYDNVVYCTVCNAEVSRETIEVEALGHTAGEVVVENNVDPTCTEAGSYDNVTYCTVCKAEVSRVSQSHAATGHNWGEWKTTTAPGCSTFGVQSRTCSGCGLVEEDASVPATGEHKFGDWKVTTEATTEAEGEETRTCECGAKETRPIEKLAPQPAPKNNTLVIVIIVVVVLAGAGVAAYFVLKNKKK